MTDEKVYPPEIIRERMWDYATRPEPTETDKKFLGVFVKCVEDIVSRTKAAQEPVEPSEGRRLVLGWLFTPYDQPLDEISSKVLTAQQVNGLKQWMSPRKVDDKWAYRSAWQAEVAWLLVRAIYDRWRTVKNRGNGQGPGLLMTHCVVLNKATYSNGKPIIGYNNLPQNPGIPTRPPVVESELAASAAAIGGVAVAEIEDHGPFEPQDYGGEEPQSSNESALTSAIDYDNFSL